jgi:hypothetical protein
LGCLFRNRNRNRGRNNRQRGNNAANQQRPVFPDPIGAGTASVEEVPAGAGEASLTGNNDAERPGNNFRRFFRWPFQGLPTIGRSRFIPRRNINAVCISLFLVSDSQGGQMHKPSSLELGRGLSNRLVKTGRFQGEQTGIG